MQISLFKKCSHCNKTKFVTASGKSKGERDGSAHNCLACRKAAYDRNQDAERKRAVARYHANRDAKLRRAHELYPRHREKQHLANRAYREKHKERLIQHDRDYYAAVKDTPEHKQRRLNWARNNKDIVRSSHHRHRARVKGGGGSFTTAEWRALCEQCGNVCARCKQSKPLTADHVIPVSKGGSSNIENIQPLCKACNSSKCDKTIDYR